MKKIAKKTPKKILKENLKIQWSVVDDGLEPIFCDYFMQVKAICLTLSQNNKQETLINHRNIIVFDTGLKLTIPEGFRLNGKLVENFSSRGLLATDFNLDERGRFTITVINLGQNSPIIIQHKEILAKVWIEPCNHFILEQL